MSKPRITKNVDDKLLIELESIAKDDSYYAVRIDGVRFSDFRVNNLKSHLLILYDSIMRRLCEDILRRYQFVFFIFYHDDEINLIFKGSKLPKKKRIQKNLSLMTSFISVRFNSLLRESELYELESIRKEYYFDARFVETNSKTKVIQYIEKRMQGVRWQVINLLENVLKIENTKYDIDVLIDLYLIHSLHNKYYPMFGFYTSRGKSGSILNKFSHFMIEMKQVCRLVMKSEGEK